MEIFAESIDRLVTVEIFTGDLPDRGIIVPEYEAARKALNGRPISLVAAQKLIEKVHSGDSVIILTGNAPNSDVPNFPNGETDGPPGAASLARAVNVGLGAVPVLIVGERDRPTNEACVRSVGVLVEDYELAKKLSTAAAVVSIPYYDYDDEESAVKWAKEAIDKYQPKAVFAIEAIGPNRKGIVHSRLGYEYPRPMPRLYDVFEEANRRGILTIGCIDSGNEIGSGTIEDTVRKVHPFGDKCLCPCGAGTASAVKSEVCFPACVSNWAAYAISATLALMLKNPEILHSAEMERRMLEACIWTGSVDANFARPGSIDGKSGEANQCIVTLLHEIIRLAGSSRTLLGPSAIWRNK